MTSNRRKATLAYILKGYPRISETFISNEILRLEQLGFTIRLFPMRRPREHFCHPSVEQIRARVDYLPTELLTELPRLLLPNILQAVRRPGAYRSALQLAARRFRRTRKSATFKHLFQGGYLADRHLRHDPAIAHLHGHFAHSPTSVTMFAAQLAGLPFSFTAHAKDIYTSDPEQLAEKTARAAFVVTCTAHNRDYLERVASRAGTPIHCLYHGIDLELFSNPEPRPVATPPYQLLTVARLTEKKGIDTIYRALRILLDRGVDFYHTLIGDGEDRETILQLIDRLELSSRCNWLGTTTHEQVLDHFRHSDLFLLGCRVARSGDRDGIPNVLVESLAMGVPALGTTVSALPEILLDGETGCTVEPDDSQALATAAVRLLEDSGLRRQVIDNGRRLVQQRFDNRILSRELARIFQHHCPPLLETGTP